MIQKKRTALKLCQFQCQLPTETCYTTDYLYQPQRSSSLVIVLEMESPVQQRTRGKQHPYQLPNTNLAGFIQPTNKSHSEISVFVYVLFVPSNPSITTIFGAVLTVAIIKSFHRRTKKDLAVSIV
jgi:hypothetical protein